VYVGFEVLSLFVRNTRVREHLTNAKALFVLLGVASILPTLATGDLAAELIGETHLIETHEEFASLTALVFAVLAMGYALYVIEALGIYDFMKTRYAWTHSVFKVWHFIARRILYTPVRVTLACIGVMLLTITGALGASIVYGPDIDPIVRFLYNLVM